MLPHPLMDWVHLLRQVTWRTLLRPVYWTFRGPLLSWFWRFWPWSPNLMSFWRSTKEKASAGVSHRPWDASSPTWGGWNGELGFFLSVFPPESPVARRHNDPWAFAGPLQGFHGGCSCAVRGLARLRHQQASRAAHLVRRRLRVHPAALPSVGAQDGGESRPFEIGGESLSGHIICGCFCWDRGYHLPLCPCHLYYYRWTASLS